MNFLRYTLLCLAIASCYACYDEHMTLSMPINKELELPSLLDFDGRECFFDAATYSLRYSIPADTISNFSPIVSFQEGATVIFDGQGLMNEQVNHLGKVCTKKKYPITIITEGRTKKLFLSFTTLPIAHVTTLNKIMDEPKRLARLILQYPSPNRSTVNSYIGIEYRGASSQKNPKKSYGFTFLKNRNSKLARPISLFDAIPQEDWILDAVYNDRLKFRNKLAFELWKEMNPREHHAISSNFVEVYLNNSYEGIYCLNEKISAEHLHLTASDAVLYKGVTWGGTTSFEYINDNNPPTYSNYWDGWEQKHPSAGQQNNWSPLKDLRHWVLKTSDADFVSQTFEQVNLENIIDYYLFIYLVGATDNHGKNMFWLKTSRTTPFSIIPWDLDASLGRDWDATVAGHMQSRENKLFDRLMAQNPHQFKQKMHNRWIQLRAGSWSNKALDERIGQYVEELSKTDVIEQDNMRWGQTTNLAAEHAYIRNWMAEEFQLLDTYFNQLQ